MTSQIRWRRLAGALAGSAIAGALLAGIGAPTAFSAPGDDSATDTQAPSMTADQAIAIIEQDYDTGSGGGQLSNLVHQVLVLRNQGFKPSNSNKNAIVAALDKRPNQEPLIAALKETISYQRRIQAQQQAQQGQGNPGFAIGGAPAPFPGGNQAPINVPLG